jgi:cyclohexanecarboxylate-CoA ligase
VPTLRERELEFMLGQCEAKVAIVPSRFRSADYVDLYRKVASNLKRPPHVLVVRSDERDISPFARVELDAEHSAMDPSVPGTSSQDIALLMYTSGTTADPKGVLHHHDSLVYDTQSIIDLFGLTAADSVFMVSPVSHISGYLFAFVLSALTGAPTVLQDRWDARLAVQMIEEHGCRFTMAAPVFIRGLVDAYRERGTSSSLAVVMCGGADVPTDLVREARDVLQAEVVRTYGLTEMPTLTSGRPDGGEGNIATDGYLVSPAECRIHVPDAPGELEVRGPELFCGYLNPVDNEAFTADGFFRTGDLATTAPDTTVTIVGRLKDVIVRGGEKISAREVEDVLFGHPAVADVAVTAMPDPIMGERVCAFIVADGDIEPTVVSLSAHLTECGVARHKHPERVVLVAELPRTASGKVQKHLLRPLAGSPYTDERPASSQTRPCC